MDTMTKKHIKRLWKWYKALMRAKKQTVLGLKNCRGRCPLGIACDVFKKETGKGKWIKNDINSYEDFVVGKDSSGTNMPDIVTKWFGFQDKDPKLINITSIMFEKRRISELNDRCGLTLKEIAQCLKEEYLEDTDENGNKKHTKRIQNNSKRK